MYNYNIIGITGKSRYGKDTTGKIIIELFENYQIVKFAQPIKNALKELYDFTYDQLETDLKEQIDIRYNITPRQAMEEMTMCYIKKHGDLFFSNKIYNKIDNGELKNIIITDVRYPEDFKSIKKRGGIIIKIVKYIEEIKINNYENYDFVIVNNSTINNLKEKIKEIFNISN